MRCPVMLAGAWVAVRLSAAIGMTQELLGELFATVEATVNDWHNALETMSNQESSGDECRRWLARWGAVVCVRCANLYPSRQLR